MYINNQPDDKTVQMLSDVIFDLGKEFRRIMGDKISYHFYNRL